MKLDRYPYANYHPDELTIESTSTPYRPQELTMQPHLGHGDQKDDREVSTSLPPGPDVLDRVTPGSIIDILGSRHRIVALVKKRVLASDLRTHHLFLTQDADGSIQLPRISTIRGMIECGQAVPVMALAPPSETDRMKVLIDMLDAADVRQGDKAIWIFLAAHWTAALEAEFGPHDPPWKIRRWRAALRRTGRPGTAS